MAGLEFLVMFHRIPPNPYPEFNSELDKMHVTNNNNNNATRVNGAQKRPSHSLRPGMLAPFRERPLLAWRLNPGTFLAER